MKANTRIYIPRPSRVHLRVLTGDDAYVTHGILHVYFEVLVWLPRVFEDTVIVAANQKTLINLAEICKR